MNPGLTSKTHPVRRTNEARPSYNRFRIIIKLSLRETRSGELQKTYVIGRDGGDGQLWVFLSQSGDDLHVSVKALAIDHFSVIRKQLWRVVRVVIVDEGEIVRGGHLRY